MAGEVANKQPTDKASQTLRKSAGAMHKVYIDPAFGVPIKNCPMALVDSPYTAAAEPEYAILEGKKLARPFSAFTDVATAMATFIGFSQRPIEPIEIVGSVTRDQDDCVKVMVYGVCEIELDCTAAEFQPFDLVGPELVGGAVSNTQGIANPALAEAYGRVVENEPDGHYPFGGTTTKVRVRAFSKFYNQ